MRSTVSCGWLMKATWELLTSTVCAPARVAIARSATGGIALSLLATMYQLRSVFQPAGPDGPPPPDNAPGHERAAGGCLHRGFVRRWHYLASLDRSRPCAPSPLAALH